MDSVEKRIHELRVQSKLSSVRHQEIMERRDLHIWYIKDYSQIKTNQKIMIAHMREHLYLCLYHISSLLIL